MVTKLFWAKDYIRRDDSTAAKEYRNYVPNSAGTNHHIIRINMMYFDKNLTSCILWLQ